MESEVPGMEINILFFTEPFNKNKDSKKIDYLLSLLLFFCLTFHLVSENTFIQIKFLSQCSSYLRIVFFINGKYENDTNS